MRYGVAILLLAMAGPALAQSMTEAGQGYVQAARMLAVGDACKALNAVDRRSVEALRDLRLAQLEILGGAAAVGAARTQAASAATAASAPGSCTETVTQQIRQSGAQTTLIWLLRAEAALALREPWADNLTTLAPQRSALTGAIASLRSQNAAQLNALQAQIAPEAARMLALACADRVAVRWVRGERPCPNLAERAQVSVARAWLAGIEVVVPAFVAATVPLGAPAAAAASVPPGFRRLEVPATLDIKRANGQPLWLVYKACEVSLDEMADQYAKVSMESEAERQKQEAAVKAKLAQKPNDWDLLMEAQTLNMEGIGQNLTAAAQLRRRGRVIDRFTALAEATYAADAKVTPAAAKTYVAAAKAPVPRIAYASDCEAWFRQFDPKGWAEIQAVN